MLSTGQSGMRDMTLSAAIAGAGIAGLAAATLLARRGWRVEIFDKSPAPAPVGSGLILQPVGLAVLNRLGCLQAISDRGARIDRLFGRVVPSNRIVLDVRYGSPGSGKHGIAVHRDTLFRALLTAARHEGLAITHSSNVASVVQGRGGEWLQMIDGARHGPFDLVIDGLGARSALSPGSGRELSYGALWASLDWPASGFMDNTLEQRYEYASCMAGVLPIGQPAGSDVRQAAFFWSIKQEHFDSWRRVPLDQWKEAVLRVWPQAIAFVDQIASHDDLVMARYRHRTRRDPVSGRTVHLGDSFHATSPQLGQGANMALLDALALDTALDMQPDLDTALGEYARMRATHVWLYQFISLVFTPFYQSDSRLVAALRDHLLSPASRLAPVQWLLGGMVAGELGYPLRAMRAAPFRGTPLAQGRDGSDAIIFPSP
ncbi:FAD-dependent monooxygenase [Aquisalinus flavus]|nr:FAD-dependent monooxygenase [Aquisalinus flavus]